MAYKALQNLVSQNPTPTHQSGKLSPTDHAVVHATWGGNAPFPSLFSVLSRILPGSAEAPPPQASPILLIGGQWLSVPLRVTCAGLQH